MGQRIVLVDDEADILAVLSEALVGEGYEPVAFVHPAHALSYCLAEPPALVITDLLMPVLSGRELVGRLRDHFGATLPIVVMSASVHLGAVAALPIQAFLSKPFDLDDVSDLLRSLLMLPSPAIPLTADPPVW